MADLKGRLAGKVALITGTGGAQGRAAALRFAREGARVVGCDKRDEDADETAALVTRAGGEMASLAPLDLSDEEQVERWVRFAVERYGDFDILYNNASACRFALVEEMTREEWDFTLANELTLIFLATKHAIPVLRRRGGGAILNTASMVGIIPSTSAGGVAHCVTKAGVISMTRALAVELAPDGVRVNCISPGLVDTPALRPRIEAEPDRYAAIALNDRIGEADDIALGAVYLCSDEAIHVTGVNLSIDGGAAVVAGRGRPATSNPRFSFN